MAKYLLLKHYRGALAPVNDVSMDPWAPGEVEDHIRFMSDFAARLEATGELVAAYLHERNGELELAARLYADAGAVAPGST